MTQNENKENRVRTSGKQKVREIGKQRRIQEDGHQYEVKKQKMKRKKRGKRAHHKLREYKK